MRESRGLHVLEVPIGLKKNHSKSNKQVERTVSCVQERRCETSASAQDRAARARYTLPAQNNQKMRQNVRNNNFQDTGHQTTKDGVITERQEINRVSPLSTLAFCREFPGLEQGVP